MPQEAGRVHCVHLSAILLHLTGWRVWKVKVAVCSQWKGGKRKDVQECDAVQRQGPPPATSVRRPKPLSVFSHLRVILLVKCCQSDTRRTLWSCTKMTCFLAALKLTGCCVSIYATFGNARMTCVPGHSGCVTLKCIWSAQPFFHLSSWAWPWRHQALQLLLKWYKARSGTKGHKTTRVLVVIL